jgi:DNA-binding protein Fis
VSMEVRDRVLRDPVSGEAIPLAEGEEAEKVIQFELEYSFEGEPATLGLATLPILPNGGRVAIGFVMYHLGVAVNDFRYSVAGTSIELDWEDPWHSRFRQRTMRRTYDSPLNVFLYAEPYEMRVEVVVRPLDLQAFVDLGLEGKETILPAEYGVIQDRVVAFLSEHFELEVEGERVVPVLERVHFLRRTLKSSTVIDPPEELSVFSAQLGVIFVAPQTKLPKEATVKWKVFPEKLETIPVTATDEAGSLPGTIDRENPVLVWTNFLKNPTDVSPKVIAAPAGGMPGWFRQAGMVGLALGGLVFVASLLKSRRGSRRWAGIAAGGLVAVLSLWVWQSEKRSQIESGEAREIVATLLYNVYRSFDFRQEEEVYDMLAKSVDGPLLETTYLETRRGLVLQNQGGARAKVNEVELQEVEPEPTGDGDGFSVEADWVVGGSVGHWGHIHQRRNRYLAHLKIEPVDGKWKITGMDVTSEERTK